MPASFLTVARQCKGLLSKPTDWPGQTDISNTWPVDNTQQQYPFVTNCDILSLVQHSRTPDPVGKHNICSLSATKWQHSMRVTCTNYIHYICKLTGCGTAELLELAQDRDVWRKLEVNKQSFIRYAPRRWLECHHYNMYCYIMKLYSAYSQHQTYSCRPERGRNQSDYSRHYYLQLLCTSSDGSQVPQVYYKCRQWVVHCLLTWQQQSVESVLQAATAMHPTSSHQPQQQTKS